MSKEEFTAFAEKYMDTIYRVAYSWTKNSDDANDVTQDVLIQLYKTTKEFESDSHVKNWLIKVTVNQCKMLFRSPWSKMEDIGEYADTLGFEEKSHLDLFRAVRPRVIYIRYQFIDRYHLHLCRCLSHQYLPRSASIESPCGSPSYGVRLFSFTIPKISDQMMSACLW